MSQTAIRKQQATDRYGRLLKWKRFTDGKVATELSNISDHIDYGLSGDAGYKVWQCFLSREQPVSIRRTLDTVANSIVESYVQDQR